MITISKLHNLLWDFALIKNLDVKAAADPIPVRLFLPIDALNALMSDFQTVFKGGGPEFKVDEDNRFYAEYMWVNMQVDICEGPSYKLEDIIPNQLMENADYTPDPILPGRQPLPKGPKGRKELQPKSPKLEVV